MIYWGGGTGRIGEVLSCGNTCGAVVWVRYLGVVGANGAEAVGSSCWVPATGEKI